MTDSSTSIRTVPRRQLSIRTDPGSRFNARMVTREDQERRDRQRQREQELEEREQEREAHESDQEAFEAERTEDEEREQSTRRNEMDAARVITSGATKSVAHSAAHGFMAGYQASEAAAPVDASTVSAEAVPADQGVEALLSMMRVSMGGGSTDVAAGVELAAEVPALDTEVPLTEQADSIYDRFPELRPQQQDKARLASLSAQARRVYTRFPELDPAGRDQDRSTSTELER